MTDNEITEIVGWPTTDLQMPSYRALATESARKEREACEQVCLSVPKVDDMLCCASMAVLIAETIHERSNARNNQPPRDAAE